MSALFPVEFPAPTVAPTAPYGLYSATKFVETTAADAARRWLPSGVQFRRTNHLDGWESTGIWDASWCAAPGDLTEDNIKKVSGERPEDPDPYVAATVWAYAESKIGGPDEAEARLRVRRLLEFNEPIDVEREFATRLLADAGTPATVDSLAEAVATIEESFAATSTTGFVHARAGLLTIADTNRLIIRDGPVLRTPAGHRWIFAGGYAATPLGDTIIGTSPTYGWRDAISINETIQTSRGRFVTIAERSVLIGYEHSLGAATVTP